MNILRRTVAVFLLLSAASLGAEPASQLASAPTTQPVAANAATFEEVGGPAGFVAALEKFHAHAGAWGDVNGDGYPDLYWGAWTDQGPDRLFINQRDGTFKESRQPSINRTDARASGSVFADVDNDGDLDLVVINNWRTNAPCGNLLLANDGKGNFIDVTAGSGLELTEFSGRNPFVLDYDGDGRLDLIVQDDQFGGKPGFRKTVLLRNLGGLKFKDATAASGLPAGDGELLGLGGAVGDVNGDGWPDFLHVGSIRQDRLAITDIRLFLNNRDGTFRQSRTFDFGATWPQFNNGEDWVCGAAFGDLNGDGRIDIVVGHHFGSPAEKGDKRRAVAIRAYLNLGNDAQGNPRWKDITQAAGLRELFAKQPHVEIQDFNNDGRMDIWNSAAIKGEKPTPCIYYNQGNDAQGVPHFALPAGVEAGLRYTVVGPTADYDLDGRLDIFMAPASLFHNITKDTRYLNVKVDLGEGKPNRYGVGAKVSVYPATRWMTSPPIIALIEIDNGYVSGREATAHFGVPGQDAVDVVVELPCGGPVLKAKGVKVNQLLIVKP